MLCMTYAIRDKLPDKGSLDFYFFIALYFFDVFLSFLIIPWTVWNWHLAMTGSTQVEYSKQVFKQKEEESNERTRFIKIYRITAWKENLFIIFGTWNIAKVIFLPSERILPLRGLEWSFMNFASKIELTGSTNKKNDDTDNLL